MQSLKSGIKGIIRRLGYDIRQVPPDWNGLGRDPFGDMRRLTSAPIRPVVFDVGANIGQSITSLRRCFGRPIIHSFEPTLETFTELRQRTADIPDLHLNNLALGSQPESRPFIERKGVASVMNSFLEPGTITWGEVTGTRLVEISTIDRYCERQGIERIDILKTDTEGFDLEVLRGGESLMKKRAIELIFMEIILCDMYRGQACLDEIYRFLTDRGFALVSFYMFNYLDDRARYTDALFIQPDYIMKTNRSAA